MYLYDSDSSNDRSYFDRFPKIREFLDAGYVPSAPWITNATTEWFRDKYYPVILQRPLVNSDLPRAFQLLGENPRLILPSSMNIFDMHDNEYLMPCFVGLNCQISNGCITIAPQRRRNSVASDPQLRNIDPNRSYEILGLKHAMYYEYSGGKLLNPFPIVMARDCWESHRNELKPAGINALVLKVDLGNKEIITPMFLLPPETIFTDKS